MSKKVQFDNIEDAINDIANGRMVIVLDDEDRENEGDLVMAAQFATPEAINFMIKNAKGLVCLPATNEILDKFELKQMVEKNNEKLSTAFTVSIDASQNTELQPAFLQENEPKQFKFSYHQVAMKVTLYPLAIYFH